jgi:hypothetical protein
VPLRLEFLAIGAVAGQHGPFECVALHACCTVKDGQAASAGGRAACGPVCWTTQVLKETGRELCERFICSPTCLPALVEDLPCILALLAANRRGSS